MANTSSGSHTLSLMMIIITIYSMGLAASLLILVLRAVSQHKYINTLKECHDKQTLVLLSSLKNKIGIKKDVSISLDNNGSMPLVHGMIKPKIVLPQKSISADSTELKLILSHELMHIKHLDILKLWIIEIASAVNWFNPVMYFVKKIVNTDIEFSCDEKVMRFAGKSNRYDYSRIIAEYSTKHKLSALVFSSGINSTGCKNIKTRISLIKDSGSTKTLSSVLIVITALVFLTACTTMNLNKLPSSFDWRDKGVVTTPQNQGDYAAGSIFAAVSLMESNIAINHNELVDLSEQYVINNSDDYSADTGVSPAAVLNFLCSYGTVPEHQLEYTGIKGEHENITSSHTLSSWASCDLGDKTPDEKIEAIKSHLIQYGPVITPITFYSDLHDYDGGVYQWDKTSEANYGHWLTIVGWNDDKSIKSGGYWIVKESWGSEWGEDGYAKIAYNDECGIDDYSIYYAEKPKE